MCKLLYLHTEVDNNVEGTRFQQESVMYYRGISYKVLAKEKKAKSLPGIYRGVKHGPLNPQSDKVRSGIYRGVAWSV